MTAARDLSSSTIFHVLNRGADRQNIFWKDRDRRVFLEMFSERAERHSVSVLAYALMSNHYHAVLDVEYGDLPSMMREFQACYAQRLNLRTDRTGPLFERRYTSVPITDDAQFVQTVRYVHRNPVAITGVAGLVAWKWSSLGPAVTGARHPSWLRLDMLRRRMDLNRHLDEVLAPRPCDRVPYAWLAPLRRTTLDELEEHIEQLSDCLQGHRRTLALVVLCDRFRAGAPSDVAERVGVSPKTIRNMRAEGKARLIDDPSFARDIARVVELLN